MKKKDLLLMKKLPPTERMKEVARENPIKTITVKTSWGQYRQTRTCKFSRFFRIAIENNILKAAVYTQNQLEEGETIPKYEVYCDRNNQEYITYEPAENRWRTAKIDNLNYGCSYIYSGKNWQTEGDRKRINEYFGTEINKNAYTAILDFQADIKKEQLCRKHRSELEEIDEVMNEVPELPKNFDQWVIKNCFKETMFYEPESMYKYKWTKMYCSHCGTWMDTLPYPNRPEHNKEGKCPKCGVKVIYKSWNRQKVVADDVQVGVLQRLEDDSGWILRRFECKMKRRHENGWKDIEFSKYEMIRVRLDNCFVEREYFEKGEYKHTGVVRWCHEVPRGYYSYYYTKYFGSVYMYTPNLKRELKKESFHGADLKRLMHGGERTIVRPVNVLRRLYNFPFIEYLQKGGLNEMVDEIMEDKADSSLFEKDEERINDVLRLDKQRFQRLKKFDGGCDVLRALQYERITGQKVSDENIKFILSEGVDVDQAISAVERTGMNLQRTLNYLQKQMKITEQGWSELYRHYEDYLNMAEAFGMDLTDEIVCRQQKLMEYHDRYTARKNREKNKVRDVEVDAKYPMIAKNLNKFRERFEFKTKEYEIVVPTKASDITKEGRQQHHCVGASDTYIANMNNERYFILFLRKKKDLKKPYYTLEVTWDGEIKQLYAAYDRQPNKEKIQKVLERFTKKVQKRELEMKKKMQECEERDGMKAKRIGIQWVMGMERSMHDE